MNEKIKEKLTAGASIAGYGLIFQGITLLIASHGTDPNGWGMLLTGVGAVLRD